MLSFPFMLCRNSIENSTSSIMQSYLCDLWKREINNNIINEWNGGGGECVLFESGNLKYMYEKWNLKTENTNPFFHIKLSQNHLYPKLKVKKWWTIHVSRKRTVCIWNKRNIFAKKGQNLFKTKSKFSNIQLSTGNVYNNIANILFQDWLPVC